MLGLSSNLIHMLQGKIYIIHVYIFVSIPNTSAMEAQKKHRRVN